VKVIILTPESTISGLFRLTLMQKSVQHEVSFASYHQPEVNNPTVIHTRPPVKTKSVDGSDIVLLLHTSGTSGKKKLVSYSIDKVIVGVACIISSWNLSPDDVCLNMMPLFHVGGIFRNILSPLLSGGAVITCSGFDPLLFWDVLYSNQRVTWYYAAPTMHHAILLEAESSTRSKPLPVSTVRFLANAAGALLPVLANSLRDTFQAVILTSYGMTEWSVLYYLYLFSFLNYFSIILFYWNSVIIFYLSAS
jgi:acyl-CoA synthetase (AMP-forming)/AMP-acid ligase II